MEAGIQGNPGFRIGFRGHGGDDFPEDLQFLGSAAFCGQAGGRDFDVRTRFREVTRRVLPKGEIVCHFAGHNERPLAGPGDRQAQGGAGAECLADHRAADSVFLRQGSFGAELAADRDCTGLDVPADGVEHRLGGTEPRKGTEYRLSCCPAV
jgi:hypothetical protein